MNRSKAEEEVEDQSFCVDDRNEWELWCGEILPEGRGKHCVKCMRNGERSKSDEWRENGEDAKGVK